MNHNCHFGLGVGQLHPDMDPTHLCNNVFWDEPVFAHDNILDNSNEYKQLQQHLENVINTNQSYLSEPNGEETSRTENYYNTPNHGQHFRPY